MRQPSVPLGNAAMATVENYSLLDRDVPSPEQKGEVSKTRARRAEPGSVSAAIGRENARLQMASSPTPRFPGEDAGRSLAEMARADLDAALQLLAERAQYITAASGVAIALRRGENPEMLCRARSGSNAPELGALLSMEYGLSGESVRTRQPLRCDDTERDPRVNRDLCHELQIASVVIVPILNGQEVVGIFELLSSKTKAFSERDLSALTRLAEMVATVVNHSGLDLETLAPVPMAQQSEASGSGVVQQKPQMSKAAAETPSEMPLLPEASPPQPKSGVLAKKPLFWSAALQAQAGSAAVPHTAENAAVPAVLRNLKKCQACGFPVSQGRTFCVECEEKQWRGRNPAQPASARPPEAPTIPTAATAQTGQVVQIPDSASSIAVEETQPVVAKLALAAAAAAAGSVLLPLNRAESSITDEGNVMADITPSSDMSSGEEKGAPVVESPNLFLSSAAPTESWLATNKYILIALLSVVLTIGAIAVFH